PRRRSRRAHHPLTSSGGRSRVHCRETPCAAVQRIIPPYTGLCLKGRWPHKRGRLPSKRRGSRKWLPLEPLAKPLFPGIKTESDGARIRIGARTPFYFASSSLGCSF